MNKQTPYILIVDDDPNLLGAVSDILKLKGFKPVTAMTGDEAMARVREHHMDVALIDLRLGGASGLEVLRNVKQISPTTECILLTGYATQSSAIEAIQLGAFGYFQKPFDMEQVLLFIQRAIEKYEAGEALRASEARFHSFIQNAADLILVINAAGIILYASPSSERIMGYTPQECVGRNFLEWVHADDMHLALASLNSRAKIPGTAQASIEVRGLHKNGNWRVIEVLGTNLLHDPAIQGIVMNMRDVTDRKTIEEQVHKSEERFRALIENSADAITLLDREGVVIYESPAAARIWNSPIDTRMGRKIFDLLDSENLDSQKAFFQNALQNPNLPMETVFRYMHKDKTYHFAEATLTNLLDEPSVNAVVVNYRDITNRKLAEDALRASEALLSEAQRIGRIGHWEWFAPSEDMVCSDELYSILEIPKESGRISRAKLAQIMHPDDLKKMKSFDFGSFNQRANIDYEYRILLPDGRARWIHQQANVTYDETGAPRRMMGIMQDVTERKEADEALRDNEERYRLLFENAPVGIFSATTEGWIVEINSVALQVLGSPSLDETSKINLLTFPLLVQTGFSSNFQKCIDTGQTVFAEQSYASKWGKSFYAQYRMTPIRDVDGSIILVQTILEDITERKSAEDRMQKLAFMLDTAPNSITVHDFDGNFLMANQTTLDMHGYTREEFMTMNLSRLDVPQSWALAAARMQKLRETGQDNFEVIHFRKDGSTIPLQVSARVANWGEKQAILSIATDITERKQAEVQLRLQSSALNAVANSILLTDITGAIKWVNPSFSKLTGYTLEEVLDKNPRDLLKSGVHDNAFYKQMWDVILAGEVWQGEITNRRKNGTHYTEELTITPLLNEEGEISHFIAVKQDITTRKQAMELVVQQKEQLRLLYEVSQRLNRTLDLQEIYQSICDFMSTIAANDGLVISAFDRDTQLITCRAFWVDNHWLDVSAFPPIPLEEEGHGTQSVVIRSGKSMLINDYQEMLKTSRSSYFVNGETNEIATEAPPEEEDVTRSALIIPLRIGDMVNGVIQVMSYRLNAYNENQLQLLESLALHIASAEQNALLYARMQTELNERRLAEESTHQRVAELGLLYESGLAFGKLLNPKEIAQKIISLLEQKMDWHHTAIRLYQPETKTLQLLAFNQPNVTSVEELNEAEQQLKVRVMRLNQGLSGWVVQHDQSIRSNDLIHDERYIETLPGMKCGLYVPIKLGSRVIGVISIESEKENAFSEADERLTSTLANQAASAFENARLFDETRQRIMELTALHRSGQTLLGARLNAEQIYAAVRQAVSQTMACDAFTIVLEDENQGDYHAVYFFDKDKRFPPRRLPRGKGISGYVLSTGKTLLVNDSNELAGITPLHFGSMEISRSIMAVPLRRGDEIIGMLSTQSYQPHAFGEPQRVLLETITAQLSSALDNAHLYQQTQARIKDLEILHLISTSLRTIQSVDEALSNLLDNTLSALETDAGAILLYNPLGDELQDSVSRGWFEKLSMIHIKVGEGVAGTVFASGIPYSADEFVRDGLPHISTRKDIPSGWGGVCLPINSSTEVIGVFFVSVQLPRTINVQQMHLLESVADMAGAALHRMRLFNETSRRAEEFVSLYETSKALSAEYDLDSLLRVIVQRTMNMLNASTSGMYLYHADTQELELMMDTSQTLPIGARLRLGEGVAGKVAQNRQPLRIADYMTWDGHSPQFEGLPIHAVMEVPMLYAGELIGVLTADETGDSKRTFTDADERLLSLFASQAAGAINSARHREDTIRHAEELEQRVIERTAEIDATRKRLDLAASAGGIGVWEINFKDLSVYWDARMHMIHGTQASDFSNSLDDWWKMVHPQDLPLAQRQFQMALSQTGLYTDEYRIILPEGTTRFVAAKAIVIYGAEHKPERMIGVNMDITESKRAEEAMHHANFEMERALRTKDEFLANMSHELRTPLNAILGISESLEEQFVGALNEKQLKYTGIIRESGRHLLELINDILDISKIEAGRMELDLQNLSVEKICQSSLRMIKELAQKKKQSVSFEIKGDVKNFLGDERRLKQALVNLLGNAVKFTAQGGRIGLIVEGHTASNEITFNVWDTGVGIAENDIQYLFKPFVQLDGGLSREYQGTGLGLALVAQMIRLHGGRVHVESELGVGSRFIITLPWTGNQQNLQAGVTSELPKIKTGSGVKRNGKILLVEDTDVVITLMSEYLLYKGYKVLVARNGYEGVMLAKQEHPDLILMDVMMPVMDGLEASRQIRMDQSLQDTPIIALTALAMAGDRELCLAAGMNDYMSKPIKMQELADIIDKHLGDGTQPSQVK